MKINIVVKKEVEVKFIRVSANVRYWDDACINGKEDETGANVPFKNGDVWEPVIDVDSGLMVDWPDGVEASFHFKICDAGSYYLLDEELNELASIDNNYVPDGLCHGDSGYGDYIIFSVDKEGFIVGYSNKINEENWFDND